MSEQISRKYLFASTLFCLLMLAAPSLVFADATERQETMKLAGFMDEFMQGFKKGVEKGTGPALTSLFPAQVQEAVPFTLQLKGSGFDAECSVMIQVLDPQSAQLTWMKFGPQLLDEQTLQISFDKGFSMNPPMRKVYVANARGNKSQELTLEIASTSGGASVLTPSTIQNGFQTVPSQGSLSIRGIDPATIEEGVPFLLTVSGSGFTSDTTILVEVNKNAGNPDAEPEYDFIPFTPNFIHAGELQLEFTNGFSSNPAQRRVYVEDASGSRSNEVQLTINP